ncbi:hypothetical protein EOL20_26175, partial [Citrobacter freundii]
QAARRASEASQSPPHRHILRRARTQVRAFFSHVAQPGGDEKPGPGFDYWRSQLDRLRAQRTGCPQGEYGLFFRILHLPDAVQAPYPAYE